MNNKEETQQSQLNSRTAASPLGRLQATLLFWPIAVLGATLDLWSKHAVFQWLDINMNEYYIVIEGFLRIIPRENSGAAFSMFQGWTYFLVTISVVAMLTVIGIFFFVKIHSRLMLFALGCMTGGIIGNLYDRAFNEGRVRDFIDVLIPIIDYPWPTFNVADSLLCIGVGLLIISNLKEPIDGKQAKV